MRDDSQGQVLPALKEESQEPVTARLRTSLLVASASFCLIATALPRLSPEWQDLSAFFLLRQDTWLLICALAVLTLCFVRLRSQTSTFHVPRWAVWALPTAVFCVCLAGHNWVLDGYDLSRDEQMASFDALIIGQGRLVQSLSAPWQAHAEALNTLFMQPVSHPIAWVSSYLPMNAAIRTLVGLVAPPSLTGPLLTALGVVALWNCARRLWPQEREPAIIAVLLYASSGQVLFAGMTSYAMPAHLTFDLLWLWLFLVRKPAADVGALAVGWVATGLHQPLFHPLFAAPFLVGLLRDRAWSRVAVFGVGYAVICTFWLAWPMFIHSLVTGPNSVTAARHTDYVSRFVDLLTNKYPTGWADMSANLLRFAAWQPVLVLPLMAAGVMLGRRERLIGTLAACVALPILVMAMILPYQGHGFGYRYLHGVLGPAILLAGEGWRQLVRSNPGLRPLMARSTIATFAALLPLQAAMAHAFYAPFARIDAGIRASGADYAIVAQDDAAFAQDLVINRPDLSNRPLRLLAGKVTDDLVSDICQPGVRVALSTDALFAPWNAYLGTTPADDVDARFAPLSRKLEAAGCRVDRIGER